MKRIFTLMMLFVAALGTVKAWEPVIKETHWFGVYEYDDYRNGDWGWGPFTVKRINWSGNYIESIEVAKEWTGQNPQQQPKTSFYSWLDHQLRFSVNVTGNWDVDRNTSNNYKGLGLYNKADGATNFWIHNLKQGDKFNVEYYRDPSNNSSPFLVTGSVEGRTPGNSYSGDNAIYGAVNNTPVYYTMTADGDVQINIPSHTVIRSVTIQHAAYQKATSKIEQIEDNGNIGYKTTMTGAGVLEDKRGAIPYLTMRFGAENDMTFVRNVGDPGNGVTYYAASSIVDESNDFNPSSAKLQALYRNKSAADMKRFLANKEWSVFTAEPDGNGDDFNSIYPLYGSYFYFFPEVNGKLIMEFYCEGSEETPAFWYKRRADGSFPQVEDQPSVTKEGVNGNYRTSGGNFYRYTVDVDKGGIYYLCSMPTNIEHEHPILRLMSYAFIPAFRLAPLWYVATDAEKASGTIDHAAEMNQDFTITTDGQPVNLIKSVKCEGNIASAEPYFEGKVLKFRNIKYKSETENDPTLNDGGAVIVNVECASGKATFVLTVPYSAEKAVAATDANKHLQRVRDTDTERNPDGKEVKKWDFFSNVYAVGQYKDPSSQLYNEIHKPDGLTADWINTYMNTRDEHEPIFKSVYDMEGDNADMLKETEGLLIFSETNQVGIYNENDPSTGEFRDRYIGLIGGGELWVPGLHEGDRIVVKMGRWGNCSEGNQEGHIQIEGATDAVGNPISGDYVFGGSHELDGGSQDKSIPYGEYHFISTGGHFKIKATEDSPLVKFYSITIYRSSLNDNRDIITENNILGTNRAVLYTDRDLADNVRKEMKINLHYWGLGEISADLSNMVTDYRTASFKATAPVFSTTDNHQFSYTPVPSQFGVFRARLGVKTKDAGTSYVTDYADHCMAVGYRETMTYPYTWDFTDLKYYVDETQTLDEEGTEKDVTINDLRLWDTYRLRVIPEELGLGCLFVSGSQLYAGTQMFAETRGIGITRFNDDKKGNGAVSISGDEQGENGGLDVEDGNFNNNNKRVTGFVVPEVAAEQAIYVRAKAVGTHGQKAQFKLAGGEAQNFTYTGEAEDGDKIFAMMKAEGAATGDVELLFQGYEVEKISVSVDPKQLSANGWATESRDRVIDPELTGYMTGKPFENLVVTSVDFGGKVVGLQAMGETNLMPLSAGADNNAYIIHNTDNEAVSILNGGFHLFVPDIHDYVVGNENFNKKALFDMPATMKAQLTAGTVARDENGMRNFVLSNVVYPMDEEGNIIGPRKGGDEGFYQVKKGGIQSNGNQGYLPVDITAGGNAPVYTLMFVGGEETTAIDPTTFIMMPTANQGEYYNLNGQKMDGVPTQRGIYITGGKKVFIK